MWQAGCKKNRILFPLQKTWNLYPIFTSHKLTHMKIWSLKNTPTIFDCTKTVHSYMHEYCTEINISCTLQAINTCIFSRPTQSFYPASICIYFRTFLPHLLPILSNSPHPSTTYSLFTPKKFPIHPPSIETVKTVISPWLKLVFLRLHVWPWWSRTQQEVEQTTPSISRLLCQPFRQHIDSLYIINLTSINTSSKSLWSK